MLGVCSVIPSVYLWRKRKAKGSASASSRALLFLAQFHCEKLIPASSDPELVLDQARALDKIPHAQRGPLHGVAVAIKDVINTKVRWSSVFT